jgi:hypothetical protein
MKNLLKSKEIVLFLLFLPTLIFSQTPPPLGLACRFAVFAAPGALNSTGFSPMTTGDVGTNGGAIIGFYNVVGQKHPPSDLTAQCELDIAAAYNNLNAQTPVLNHPSLALGGGEVLSPGIHFVNGAGTLTGILELNGGGDPNACFIIKINGAFAPAIGSSVILTGGTQACNVFWSVIGGSTFGANVNFKGNIIMAGAAVIGNGCNIEGRLLTINGGINVDELTANTPSTLCACPAIVPVAFEPVQGTTKCWALLTEEGGVTDAEITKSVIVGHIGTNVGTVTGFDPLLVTGTIHPAPDTATAQASTDLDILFSYLSTMPYNIELLNPLLLGNSQVLTPNVYFSKTAATLTDTIFLDGQGDSNAKFLIRIGGALTTGSSPQVVLFGGTQAKNVFWLTEGGVTISAGDGKIIGEIVAHNGAIILNDGVTLNGRALSSFGGITTHNATVISDPCAQLPLPIELLEFKGECNSQNIELKWVTASEINNDYFSIERSIDGINWLLITKINGAGNSTSIKNYSYTNVRQYHDISYYRLKQTDFDGEFKHSAIIVIEKCEEEINELTIYPNPINEALNLSYGGDKSQILSTSMYNILGEMVYYSESYQSKIVFENKLNGIYFLHVNTNSKKIVKKFIVVD